MPKVLISDALSPAAVAVFESRGIEADVNTGLSEDALVEVIGGYDGLAVRSATKVTGRVLDAAHHLKVVGRAGIGIDNIDLEAATARGVVVMNTPFGNSVTTAEHTIAMMLALARQLPAADRSTRAGKWEKSRFMGTELAGKVLGLVGCGNIGAIVADRAHGLKMRVIAYDPYLAPERAQDLGVEKVEMEQLLARADVISLHTPLNDGTRNLLSAAALAKTRPGVRIINCARGGLLDEAALYQAIVEGHVAGAALDAFAEEPARSSPLFELEQVVVTPHLGASTVEAQEKVALQVAEQMADYLTTGAVSQRAQHALRLGRGGAAAAALHAAREPARQLRRPAHRDRPALGDHHLWRPGGEPEHAAADRRAAAGAARPAAGQRQHGQRALDRPRAQHRRDHDPPGGDRGLSDPDPPRGVDRARRAQRGRHAVPGAASAPRRDPRHRGRRPARPHMLYVRNEDRPGLIGGLGSALGDAGINIATFHLGRTRPGGDAIALIEIDQPAPLEVMQRIHALPHVTQCKVLRF